ncbi:radical SAM protein [Burkholderia plantarii]|uniref:radical SAM protein n=1 Tax=Burkholderia plantarii TaxID=41899 RepID=UPI0009F501CC|nr:radical SAM protein [Burkholderia plantarii]
MDNFIVYKDFYEREKLIPSHLFRSDIPHKFNELSAIKKYWLRVLADSQGIIVPPYEVLIHPSSVCNLRCDWCIGEYVPIERKGVIPIVTASKFSEKILPNRLSDPGSMMKVITDIVNYSAVKDVAYLDGLRQEQFKIDSVSFSGLIGEPLSSKGAVLAAMRKLVASGVRTGIFTNGTLIDEDCIDVFMNIDYVLISVDAASPSTYAGLKYGARQSGQHMFRKVLENIERLVIKKTKTNSEVAINCSFVVNPGNYRELYDAGAMLKRLGANCLRIKQENSGVLKLTETQAEEVRHQVARLKEDVADDAFEVVSIHRFFTIDETVRKFSKCGITNLVAAIGSDGNLYPCNYHPRPGGAVMGSVIDESFEEVWEGERRMLLRKSIPNICPATCDPFKNRANSLLQSIFENL